MKLTIISANNPDLADVLASILHFQDDINICLYDFTSIDKFAKLSKRVKQEVDINDALENSDLIINMINGTEINSSTLQELSTKYNIQIEYAQPAIDMIKCFGIKKELDIFAKAYANLEKKAKIINAAKPIDVVTSYLFKSHNIVSYGISLKAKNLVETLLAKVALSELKDKVKVKLGGINNNLWLTEIKDDKDKDLYPIIRDKVKDIDLKVKRNDLTRDGLRSLRFFGFYHSANVQEQNIKDAIIDIISATFKKEKSCLYLNAINNDAVYGLDSEMCVEIPFEIKDNDYKPQAITLPLQCVLALNDYAGAVSVVSKAINALSKDIFARAIKLDPYLSSILTLAELESLSNDAIAKFDYLSILK